MGVAESPRKKAKSKGKATEEGKEEGKSKGKDKDKEGKKKRGAEDSPEAKPKEKEKGKRKRDVVPHVEEGAVETAARQAQPTSSLKKKRKTRHPSLDWYRMSVSSRRVAIGSLGCQR